MGKCRFASTQLLFLTHNRFVHWIVPTLAGTLLSTALMLVFVACFSYLIESYFHIAAMIAATNTVFRSFGSAAAPLFTSFMFDGMGVGGGASLIAGVAVILAIIPFYFYRHGERMRSKSKYASTIDE